jgi:TolA-binding protein
MLRSVVAGLAGLLLVPAAAGATNLLGWQNALAAYAKNPGGQARRLLDLDRGPGSDLPPHVRLLLADAAVRTGRLDVAEAHFEKVVAADPGEPWTGWAQLGLGWIASARGETDAARRRFLDALDAPASRLTARLALALAVAPNDPVAARTLLDEADRTPGAGAAHHDAVLLALGYTAYWEGDYDRAEATFTTLVDRTPNGPLADDAAYGAAWSRARRGDRAGGVAALRALAAVRSSRGGHVPDDLLDLAPRALVADAMRRHRRSPLLVPDGQMLAFLDGDGGRLARAALARLEVSEAVDTPPTFRPSMSTRRRPMHGVVPSEAPQDDARHPWRWALLGTIAVATLVAWRLVADRSPR